MGSDVTTAVDGGRRRSKRDRIGKNWIEKSGLFVTDVKAKRRKTTSPSPSTGRIPTKTSTAAVAHKGVNKSASPPVSPVALKIATGKRPKAQTVKLEESLRDIKGKEGCSRVEVPASVRCCAIKADDEIVSDVVVSAWKFS